MRLFAGVDVGGSTTKAMLVGPDGQQLVTELSEVRTGSNLGPAHVLSQMKLAISNLLQKIGAAWSDVVMVGEASPGPATNGVLEKSANLDISLAGCDLRGGLESLIFQTESVRPPVIWYNDSNAGGFADWHAFGHSRGVGVVAIYPGTGLGGAYVSPKGEVLVGDNGCGAEVGHLPLPANLQIPQWLCGCGRTGCVETSASIIGLRNQLKHALNQPRWADHPLAKESGTIPEKAFSLRKRAQEGDALALELFSQQARVLGAVAGMCAMAFDPGVVVFGGGLMEPTATTPEFRSRLLQLIREEFDRNIFPIQKKNIQLEITTYGDLSQALGAALLARHHALQKAL